MDGEREGEMDRWMDESIDGGRERVRRGYKDLLFSIYKNELTY